MAWFERSMYWNEYKTKNETKDITTEYRHYLRSNFVGVNRSLVLIHSDKDNNAKKVQTLKSFPTTSSYYES